MAGLHIYTISHLEAFCFAPEPNIIEGPEYE